MTVDVSSPPTTTAARGRLDLRSRSACKEQGNEAKDGDEGGHQDRPQSPLAPGYDGLVGVQPLLSEAVDIGDQHHTVQHRHAEKGDEPHGRGDAQVLAGQKQARGYRR